MGKPSLFLFRNCKITVNKSSVLWQAAFLICLFSFPVNADIWTETNPSINITHIFDGEINKRGKPVGFHVIRVGQTNSRIYQILSGPNKSGVFTAETEMFDTKEKRWKRKSFSSFFPKKWSDEKIINAILRAYKADDDKRPYKFGGPSGFGVRIEGWLCRDHEAPKCPKGAIKTAYPIFKQD